MANENKDVIRVESSARTGLNGIDGIVKKQQLGS